MGFKIEDIKIDKIVSCTVTDTNGNVVSEWNETKPTNLRTERILKEAIQTGLINHKYKYEENKKKISNYLNMTNADRMFYDLGFTVDHDDVIEKEYWSSSERAYVGISKRNGRVYSGRQVDVDMLTRIDSYPISGKLELAVEALKQELGFE